MGWVVEARPSCLLASLSVDSKTRQQDSRTYTTRPIWWYKVSPVGTLEQSVASSWCLTLLLHVYGLQILGSPCVSKGDNYLFHWHNRPLKFLMHTAWKLYISLYNTHVSLCVEIIILPLSVTIVWTYKVALNSFFKTDHIITFLDFQR